MSGQCLRDVVALSTLPAMWAGAEPLRIAESLAASLFTTLTPRFVYVSLADRAGQPPITVVQTGRYQTRPDLAGRLGQGIIGWARANDPDDLLLLPDPLGTGTVRVTTRPVGRDAELGVIAAAFSDEGSPTPTHHLLLGVSATQAAVAVQNAHLLRSLRESEEVARQSKQVLDVALAASETGTFRFDLAAGVFQVFDENLKRLFGFPPDKAVRVPEDFLSVVHPDDLPAVAPAVESTVRDGVDFEMEYRVVHPDGSVRWLFDRAKAVRDAGGKPSYLIGACTDVTRRKRSEELASAAQAELRAKDERFSLLVENITDYALIIQDPAGTILEWQGGAERITGYAAHEAVGQTGHILFTPEDVAAGAPEEEMRTAERDGRAEDKRWHRRKDGSRFFASGVMTALYDHEGTLLGFGKVFRDETNRRQAEEKLRESEEYFRELTQNMPLVVWTNLPDGRVDFVNHRWLEMTGQTLEYVRSTPEAWMEALHPDDRERAGRTYLDGVLSGEGFTMEARFRRDQDGAYRWHLNRCVPIRDASGAALKFLGTCTDVEDLKRAEDALKEADRRKDEFIATLAHELRNPLAPLRNGLQVLRLADERPTRQRAQEMMDRQLGHMVRLIDDLLDVSRITRNKLELRRDRVRIVDVLNSAVETARPLIDASGHRLDVSVPPDPVLVDADITRLAQVFGNLLTNAAKYTPPGGRIWVTAESQDGSVAVAVRDTGVGIPAEALPRVFDMFTQVNRSIERETGGLGIGLALVKGLVEMHGGTVTAESEGAGKGSTFTVRLPSVAPAARSPASAALGDRGVPEGGRRILVVDDNRDSAASMAMMLQLLGDEVRVAYDGVEAVEAAEAFRPEVILMDVGMPRLNGYEATRRIRASRLGRDVTIVALTGWGQEGDRERSKEAGCDGHLVKPVGLEDLERLLTGLRPAR